MFSPLKTLFLLLGLLGTVKPAAAAAAGGKMSLAKGDCEDTCGNVPIPFPFGIGRNCSMDEWYEVECLPKEKPVPKLKKMMGLEVLNISLPSSSSSGYIQINFPVSYSSSNHCPNASNNVSVSLVGSNFVFSKYKNVFTAVGCGQIATINSTITFPPAAAAANSSKVGCMSGCIHGNISVSDLHDCLGYGCCQNTIPSKTQAFKISFENISGQESPPDDCLYAFLADRSWFNPIRANQSRDVGYAPVSLAWGINDTLKGEMEAAKGVTCTYNETDTSFAYDNPYLRCYCRAGHEGNPYLGRCGHGRSHFPLPAKLSVAVTGGFIGGVLSMLSERQAQRTIRRRSISIRKSKFFEQNGGNLLGDIGASLIDGDETMDSEPPASSGLEVTMEIDGKMAEGGGGDSSRDNIERGRLFKAEELEKATDNFNSDRTLGQGGRGTVYKGMLANGRVVAVKKSAVPDEAYAKQFIAEVCALSRINHRNVVKLLGFCLETEVPQLVYEFVPNGTLYQHLLHDSNKEVQITLTWDLRLRIACEVSGALSILHSAKPVPIYHRDMKTSNILLDESYQAKIADFGLSKSVALDQTHGTTTEPADTVQTTQYTEKDDVYSFGVVLVELLTGEKPISSSLGADTGKSLAGDFILSMEEHRLLDILDARVVKQENQQEAIAVAHLAKRCLSPSGTMRPRIEDVAAELESIRRASHPSHEQETEEPQVHVTF
ncbi:hypothetical protein SAY86_018968 [Trapa natans]|uniref:Protein kinase domain-containing protein n=1 Tax=Trapa natans TaxID=22666 RepID=A0AAN7LNT2_TRANT|nr:hypothetical protein SAY86_018968 [Trapa natans]